MFVGKLHEVNIHFHRKMLYTIYAQTAGKTETVDDMYAYRYIHV
jgi:hypothetical protein